MNNLPSIKCPRNSLLIPFDPLLVNSLSNKREDGALQIEISSNSISFNGRQAILVLAVDVTQKKKYIDAIELQNAKLREIAWIQSHVVRAPPARLLGLVNLLGQEMEGNAPISLESLKELLVLVKGSTEELDAIIKEIISKTERVKLD